MRKYYEEPDFKAVIFESSDVIMTLFLSVFKAFKSENIYENKEDDSLNDEEAAKRAEEEIIRIAHMPD